MDQIISNSKERYLSISAQSVHRLLPQRYPLQILDSIKRCYLDEGRGIGVKQVTMTDPVLNGHFPGMPIYPGVLLIEAMAQNAGVTAMLQNLYQRVGSYEAVLDNLQSGRTDDPLFGKLLVLAESRIKHIQPVFPGQGVELHAKVHLKRDAMIVFKVSAWVDGIQTSVGQMSLVEMPSAMSSEISANVAVNT